MNIEYIKQEMQSMVDDGYLISFYFYKHRTNGLVFVGVSDQGESIYFEQYPDRNIYSDWD